MHTKLLPFLDCRMRYEVPNLQFIYLLKMCCNLFIHFLIADQAHVKCQCCVILAILPFVTLLITEDEARSVELVQAISFSYPFFSYSSELLSFFVFFLAYQ